MSRHVVCRPAGLAKKLKTRLVVECINVSHLENALDMSKAQATSFVQAYYANEEIRFDRSKADAYDDMLLQRSKKMIGSRVYNLLGADTHQLETQERHMQLQSNMDRLEQKMQEQHDNLLAALQSLAPTQGSTSAPQPSSALYARTGQANAVYNPPASNGDDFTGPVNGGSATPAGDRGGGGGGGGGRKFGGGSGGGFQDIVVQPPPRHSIQGQNSTAHAGVKEGTYHVPPSQTRAEVQETSDAPHAQTGAYVLPTDLVFWR